MKFTNSLLTYKLSFNMPILLTIDLVLPQMHWTCIKSTKMLFVLHNWLWWILWVHFLTFYISTKQASKFIIFWNKSIILKIEQDQQFTIFILNLSIELLKKDIGHDGHQKQAYFISLQKRFTKTRSNWFIREKNYCNIQVLYFSIVTFTESIP